MKPQFTNLVISTRCDSPCSERQQPGCLQDSNCSSPDCWEQGSSCSSASSASWQLDEAASKKQQQLNTSVYTKLRVSIPGAFDSSTAGSSPIEAACAASVGSGSCSSTPGSAALLCGPALFAGNPLMLAGQPVGDQYLQGGCLSFGSSAARRLLACDVDDSAEVCSWLDQQISMRQGARAATCNIDGPGAPEIEGVEVLGAAAGGCLNKRGLPAPAFQLLGLL